MKPVAVFDLETTGVDVEIARQALANSIEYRHADMRGCPEPREGDGIHVPGEPSDLICLASPILPTAQDRANGGEARG